MKSLTTIAEVDESQNLHANLELADSSKVSQLGRTSILKGSSSDDDVTLPVVGGIVGLLVVGGGIALYQKIRANRAAEAIENEIESLDSKIAKADEDIQALYDALAIKRQELKGFTELLDDFERVETRLNEIAVRLKNPFLNDEEAEQLESEEASLELRINQITELADERGFTLEREFVEKASNRVDALEKRFGDAKDLRDELQAQKRAYKVAEEVIKEDLDASLAELAEDNGIIDKNLADKLLSDEDPDLVKVFEKEIEDGDSLVSRIGTEIRRQLAPDNDAFDSVLRETKALVRRSNRQSLKEITSKLCPDGGCTDIEAIDPITEAFADEFYIEKEAVFRGNNLFGALREDVAKLGWDAEVDEIINYVGGSEFSELGGSFISAFAEGNLAAESAVSVLDIVAAGLGEDALVGGLAAEVGGELMLGEIALDLLELAVFL